MMNLANEGEDMVVHRSGYPMRGCVLVYLVCPSRFDILLFCRTCPRGVMRCMPELAFRLSVSLRKQSPPVRVGLLLLTKSKARTTPALQRPFSWNGHTFLGSLSVETTNLS